MGKPPLVGEHHGYQLLLLSSLSSGPVTYSSSTGHHAGPHCLQVAAPATDL